jgi:hypothetical protein
MRTCWRLLTDNPGFQGVEMTIEFDRSYSAADCRQEFVRAMKEAGIEFRGELVSDG